MSERALKKKEDLAGQQLLFAGIPDAHREVYSEGAIRSLTEQAKRGVPVVDHAGVQIGGTVGGEVARDGDVRVLADLQLHQISLVSRENLVDPNCVFVSTPEVFIPTHKHKAPPVGAEKEEAMADSITKAEGHPEAKGYLSEKELVLLEGAVRRAKDMLAPETYDRLTRALWELGNLRELSRRLLDEASVVGLIEHSGVLRSRAAKE